MPLPPSPAISDFQVVCLCADWCGTCRDYRTVFVSLSSAYPGCRFLWIDIEEQADLVGDLEIDNFPTLLICRQQVVLFFGTLLPHPGHLRRLLETLGRQTPAENRAFVHASAERQRWQEIPELLALARAC